MSKLTGKLRWYPGDPLVEIGQGDLGEIAKSCGADITVDEIEGTDFTTEDGMVLEETGNKTIEEITQTVVTVSAPNEDVFRECVSRLIDMYRAPRTVYSFWGSDERAKEIIIELADEWDGWL